MEKGKKRFYWLKLNEDFFKQKEIKKLRKAAGGDTYIIIYLKMLLISLKTGGFLYFEGIYDDFIEELAETIDEQKDSVGFLVEFLLSKGLLEEKEPDEYLLTKCGEMTGSEGASASRMRRCREKKALQSNSETSQCDTNLLQCDTTVTQSDTTVTISDVEIEKEIEIELDKETNDQSFSKKFKSDVVESVENFEQAEPVRVRVSDKDFDTLWELYPRKEGKAKAKAAYAKAIRSGATNEQIESGIADYVSYIKRNQIERRYIKQGSTWFEGQCWNDDYGDSIKYDASGNEITYNVNEFDDFAITLSKNSKKRKPSYDVEKFKELNRMQMENFRKQYSSESYDLEKFEDFANTFDLEKKESENESD